MCSCRLALLSGAAVIYNYNNAKSFYARSGCSCQVQGAHVRGASAQIGSLGGVLCFAPLFSVTCGRVSFRRGCGLAPSTPGALAWWGVRRRRRRSRLLIRRAGRSAVLAAVRKEPHAHMAVEAGMQLIDTCVNLQDPMFRGVYNGKQKHDADWPLILERAAATGVVKMIGVSGSLEDSRQSIEVASQHDNIFASVGVHPTRCNEFEESGDPQAHLDALKQLVLSDKAEAGAQAANVVAIGEIGLDYDREQFCPRAVQLKYFDMQLDLAKSLQLPVIFHNRNTQGDFAAVVKRRRADFTTGIVHSFTGSADEMRELCDLGLYIGINGCGLRYCPASPSVPVRVLLVAMRACSWCRYTCVGVSMPPL